MLAHINFKLVKSPAVAADYILKKLLGRLDRGQRVLWLIAGGSALDIAVLIANKLRHNRNIKHLTITLSDERYGPVGHKSSNWKQLMDRGFNLPGSKLIPVLSGAKLEPEAENYSKMLNQELIAADFSIALAGMGADGHILGIKPHSPAVGAALDVIGYAGDDYMRLTPTFQFINRLDEVIIYAAGKEKHPQLDSLEMKLSADDQPAQLLKRLHNVTILNDYKGEPE